MNAGIRVRGKLQFVYPGTSQLGHDGEHGPWPLDAAGRDLSWYDNNDFGGYKSYHVFGQDTDFFGAYWHDDDFGMVRYAPRDEKAGQEDLDLGPVAAGDDLGAAAHRQRRAVRRGPVGPAVQPVGASGSTFTPFKHRGFAPHTADRWTEYWYPVVGTRGFVAASRIGALNVTAAGRPPDPHALAGDAAGRHPRRVRRHPPHLQPVRCPTAPRAVPSTPWSVDKALARQPAHHRRRRPAGVPRRPECRRPGAAARRSGRIRLAVGVRPVPAREGAGCDSGSTAPPAPISTAPWPGGRTWCRHSPIARCSRSGRWTTRPPAS